MVRKQLREVSRFAFHLGMDLFDRSLPFLTDPREGWDTALYLARKRAEARAARGARRPRRLSA